MCIKIYNHKKWAFECHNALGPAATVLKMDDTVLWIYPSFEIGNIQKQKNVLNLQSCHSIHSSLGQIWDLILSLSIILHLFHVVIYSKYEINENNK